MQWSKRDQKKPQTNSKLQNLKSVHRSPFSAAQNLWPNIAPLNKRLQSSTLTEWMWWSSDLWLTAVPFIRAPVRSSPFQKLCNPVPNRLLIGNRQSVCYQCCVVRSVASVIHIWHITTIITRDCLSFLSVIISVFWPDSLVASGANRTDAADREPALPVWTAQLVNMAAEKKRAAVRGASASCVSQAWDHWRL